MLDLSGYTVNDALHSGSRTAVYRATRDHDGLPVVLKTPRSAQPSTIEAARLAAEYQIGRAIDHDGIVRVLGLEQQRRPALVLEDFGGRALSETLARGPLELDEFLDLSARLSLAVHELHRRGVTHKDINPSNVIHNPRTGAIKLADLSIASVLESEQVRTSDPGVMEGTLSYMSPEQTGRMNRSVDHRTDLYSLGATMYTMLVGRPPFVSDDPAELVHAHIARTPEPPSAVRFSVPSAISAVVMKLLAKNAEERYQSAAGLAADLEQLARDLDDPTALSAFVPGTRDPSARFRLPERLYGRRRELDQLTHALERATEGSRELVVIEGPAGIGKSSLAQELHPPVVERHGLFVAGKFDQVQREIPHFAFIVAMRELMRHLLTLSDEHLQRWREQLLEALQGEGQVLVEAIPELATVIGAQQPARQLTHDEAEQRFDELVRRFIAVVARGLGTLVVFFDDLQWADPASLRLMERLLADDEIHNLLVLASHRTDQEDRSAALVETLEAVERGPAGMRRIVLRPLEEGHVARLVADTLGCSSADTRDLAALVVRKSLGNPLFVKQFLELLHRDELIVFDQARGCWSWDLQQIEDRHVSAHVADLLVQKVEQLPEETRRTLQVAACMGNRFDLGLLATVVGRPLTEVVGALRLAIEQGVLRTVCPGYGHVLVWTEAEVCGCDAEQVVGVACEFQHDRIQQALTARFSGAERQQVHLRYGRLLLETLDPGALEERLFEVATHLGAAVDQLQDEAERVRIAQLNLDAGFKASTAGARDAAARYFELGLGLLPGDRWERFHHLTFQLAIGFYRCILLSERGFDVGLPLGEEMLERARDDIERMLAMSVHVQQMSAGGHDPYTALERGLALLREATGLDLEPAELDDALCDGYGELDRALEGREVMELVDLPIMTDPHVLAQMELVKALISFPIMMRRRDLLPLAMLRGVLTTLEYGNGPVSGASFAGWGMVLAHQYGELARGHEFGLVGVELARRTGTYRTVTETLAASNTLWLRAPRQQVGERLWECHRRARQGGDLLFKAIAGSAACSWELASGVPLPAVIEHTERFDASMEELLPSVGMREIHLVIRMARALTGERTPRDAHFDDSDDAEQILAVMAQRNQEGLHRYHLQQSRLHYLYGDYRAALEMAELSERRQIRKLGYILSYELVLHHALALAAVASGAAGREREELVQRLRDRLALLQGWVDAGAREPFEHWALLVRAELARVNGEPGAAGGLYEQAIAAAERRDILCDLALANEVAARHYLAQGLDKVARVYLLDARYAYEKWGARAKVAQLEQAFPELAAEPPATTGSHRVVDESTGSSSTSLYHVDFESVFKVARAISGQMVLDDLLRTLLRAVIENAGAQRGFLMLRRAGELTLEAGTAGEATDVDLLGSTPVVRQHDVLSAGVAHYVARTREAVVLADASREGMFRADPYVARQRPRSLLCAPVLNQGRVVGLVYLENNLVSGAFTDERLRVVELLCAQAAISIENARLYGELEGSNRQLAEYSRTLEHKVEERTRDLAQKNEALNESLEQQRKMQQQLLISEKMASLGNLVAGVAHEINTPVGAVVSSADTATRALERLMREQGEPTADRRQRLVQLLQENLSVITTAGQRVTQIVTNLRNFARLDEAELKPADLHQGLDSTLLLVRHRLKGNIDVVRELGELDQVYCYPNQINQVFMNLIVNAIDAVEHVGGDGGRGRITIRTWMDDGEAHVEISDTGHGIPEAIRERVFDPGFTTRGVGVGTGLGLSISFNIIAKHGGRIDVASPPGEGARFTVILPARPAARAS